MGDTEDYMCKTMIYGKKCGRNYWFGFCWKILQHINLA